MVPVIATDWNNHTEESNTVSDTIIIIIIIEIVLEAHT